MEKTVKRLAIAAAGAAMLLAAVPAYAHHSGAMFELTKSATLDGTVKEFQWTNPHSWVQLSVPNAKGGVDEWSFELGPLVGLQRAGWKSKTLVPGDKIKVAFHPLRDGTPGGRLVNITFADGRVLKEGGAPAEPAPAN